MTVTIGPRRYLGTSTLLGASQFLGQGNTNTAKDVEYELLFSTDDASVSIPAWTFIQSDMRAFSTSRGRSSELADVDAGTATITLDNRARKYDPTNTSSPYNPNLRPMNRVWLRMRFNGVTHDIFKGYVESYEQQLPEVGMDAITIVKAVDEFKVLALRNLPTTDPPRETYADVIQFDNPVAYWRMTDNAAGFVERGVLGPSLYLDTSVSNGMTSLFDGLVVGENPEPYSSLQLQAAQYLLSDDRGDLDFAGATQMTAEMWFNASSTTPGGAYSILRGLDADWLFALNPAGTLSFEFVGPTSVAASVAPNVWNHVAGVFDGANISLYINGAFVAQTAKATPITAGAAFPQRIGNPSSTATIQFDEVAVYRTALTAARIAAHYTAGVNRGFARSQLARERIGRILDSITSQAPRNLLAGTRPLAGQYAGNGPHALDLLTEVKQAEAVDAVVFTASDGTLTFLDGGHRATSPWNTVQATFGDAGGSELDFMDIQLDYSDAFIANQWDVTRDGGTVQTASDTTSIGRYYRRPQSLTGLKLRDDADALDVAQDMLSKYKEPLLRVLSIQPKTMNVSVLDATFPLEVGDRIRVLVTPPGGGARVDQTLFVQAVSVDMQPAQVYPVVKLGVSPV